MFNSKTTSERAVDALISRELRNLNNHLPKKRRTLAELLRSNEPTVEAADGSTIVLKRSELEELATLVPADYHDRVKIPIVVLRRTELGKSVYTVSGDRVEEFTVKKLLKLTNDDYHDMYKHISQTFLYRPQVSDLIAKFHSLIVIGFGIPRELADYAVKRD